MLKKMMFNIWLRLRKVLNMIHIAILRLRVRDKNVTLITQNCIGGVLYSMVGQEFLSPTINMFIEDENFVKLVENLPHYLSIDPIPKDENYTDPINPSIHYPKIRIDDIELCCLHYKNCDEAIEAWNRRKQRVNLDKIVVIGNSWNMHEDETLISRLCNNKKHKTICFTFKKYDIEGCIRLIGKQWQLDERMIIRPNITDYKPFSFKRYFEDYIDIPRLFASASNDQHSLLLNEKNKMHSTRKKKMIKRKILSVLPKALAHQIMFFLSHHRFLNFHNMKTYDEKIQYLMVKKYDEKYGIYADKLRVRDYIASLGLTNILTHLYKSYVTADEICFDELPDSFVLKTNNGCGVRCLEVVADKSKADEKYVKEKLSKALRVDVGELTCQYHYSAIKPAILCEEFLAPDNNSKGLDDYKIVCNYGIPRAILVCSDRTEGRDYFDTEWNYLEYVKKEFRSKTKPQKPDKLNEMLEYAKLISKPFPLARIDFYYVGGKIYFGEITLTPSGGNHNYLSEFGQKELGRMIVL